MFKTKKKRGGKGKEDGRVGWKWQGDLRRLLDKLFCWSLIIKS